MVGRLKQFVKHSKSKKDEEAKRQKEIIEKALSMVPRCELNADLPEDARVEDLWKAIQKNFSWNFGPSKGKSLKDTKTQFLKWSVRKLKDPVKTICLIELMLREKKMDPLAPKTPEPATAAPGDAEASTDSGNSEATDLGSENTGSENTDSKSTVVENSDPG